MAKEFKPGVIDHVKTEPDEFAQLEPVKGRCNAKLRASRHGSAYCPNHPVDESLSGRCRMHGGTSKMGPDHQRWQGKGSSKALPPRLKERVQAHLDDPELTSTLHDIALASTRVDELLSQFETGEAGSAWTKAGVAQAVINEATTNLKSALAPGLAGQDLGELQKVLEVELASLLGGQLKLNEAIEAGEHERSLWNEVFDVQKHRARLVETELKREERLEQNVTAKQAVALLGVVKQLMFEYVLDKSARLEIATRLERLVSKPRISKQLKAGEPEDG